MTGRLGKYTSGERGSVRDNGAGFDIAQANRFFKAFERSHKECDFQGTGIGLAKVKR